MRDKSVKGGNARGGQSSEIFADRAVQRRIKYATDPRAGDEARSASRERYQDKVHDGAPRVARLANGLLVLGETREVITGDMDYPVAVESFSVPQAAAALGRSVITIRRWIESDKIPAPYLEDVQRHHLVYSVGELEVLARIIAQHEREFVYLASEHNNIVETLHQAVFAYRAQFV